MSRTKRSNSSYGLRQDLLKDLYIEKVNNNRSIASYFKKAGDLFQNCLEIDQSNYIARSYVSWKEFTMFVSEELIKHKHYKLEEYKIKREWCKEALTYALRQLEEIVIEMDRQEDEVQAIGKDLNIDIDLIDEFDAPILEQTSNLIEPSAPQLLESPPTPKDEQLEIKRNSLRDALKILYPTETMSPIDESVTTHDARPIYPTVAQIIQTPIQTQNNNFLSVYEAEIIKSLWPINHLIIPQPQRSLFVFTLHINSNPVQLSFYRHDFQVSYVSFLPNLHPDLKSTKCALETNRCFFIHLGVAMNLHPFALQSYFRHVAATRIHQQADPTSLETEILGSCLQYAGFVDANCLHYIWPQEFEPYRILLISGKTSPIFTLFTPNIEGNLIDILIHSDGSHFTLLKPISNEHTNFSIIPGLLQAAKDSGSIVQEILIDRSQAINTSIESTLQSLVFS